MIGMRITGAAFVLALTGLAACSEHMSAEHITTIYKPGTTEEERLQDGVACGAERHSDTYGVVVDGDGLAFRSCMEARGYRFGTS